MSDLSISRYEREFVQMSELASGQFGSVKLARHRLDGTDYAIKVNKTPLRPGSYGSIAGAATSQVAKSRRRGPWPSRRCSTA